MNNIEETVKKIRREVSDYKNYVEIYKFSETRFNQSARKSAIENVFTALDGYIFEALEYIGDLISDVYQEWEKFNSEKASTFVRYIATNVDDNYIEFPEMISLDFIRNFIENYGILELNQENGEWVVWIP